MRKRSGIEKRIKKLKLALHSYEWQFIIIMSCITFLCGIFGFSQYFKTNNEEFTLWDLIFSTLQLFTLNSGVMHVRQNLPLDFARLAAPVLPAYAAIKALLQFFSGEIQALRIGTYKNHVIICGLNRKSFYILNELLDYNFKIVIIEKNKDNSYAPVCGELGADVITGNAEDSETLKKAGLVNAEYLFCMIDDDNLNSLIINALKNELKNIKRPGPLNCIININDNYIYNKLRENEFENNFNCESVCTAGNGVAVPVKFEFYNVFDAASETLLNKYMPFNSCNNGAGANAGVPNILVIGLGNFIESHLINLINRWELLKTGRKVKITLIDSENKLKKEELEINFPKITKCCELEIMPFNFDTRSLKRLEFIFDVSGKPEYSAIYICTLQENFNTSVILEFSKRLEEFNVPVYVCCEQISSILNMFLEDKKLYRNIYIFEILSEVLTPEILVNGVYEKFAHAIHADYINNQKTRGQKLNQPESWNELSTEIKESNRKQARNMLAKLISLKYSIRPLKNSGCDFKFAAEDIEILAEGEHERWCAEKISHGWKHGEIRDDKNKIHPDLVAYEKLPDAIKQYDRDTVLRIPYLLSMINLEVYRKHDK